MAIVPVNVARVSQNLRAFNVLQSARHTELSLFRTQNQLATGLRFSVGSEDSVRAAQSSVIDRRLERLSQVADNVRTANAALSAGENAMQEGVDLMREAQRIASDAAGDTLSDEERSALASVVDRLISQMVSAGNREHLGAALFSGHFGGDQPFEMTGGGVLFRGDAGRQMAIVDSDLSQDSFTISGMDFFGAVSGAVQGIADLNPALTPETRVSDLRGTTGNGVHPGIISVSNGSDTAEVDLSSVATIQDLLDKLNAEMPADLTAVADATSVTITYTGAGAANITVTDLGGGQAARDLGLIVTGGSIAGSADLDPKLTLRARIDDLKAGTGLNLAAGITLRNGLESANVSFAAAETIEDVLNQINSASIGVWARLADDGRTIEVRNRVSGSDLRIEENGGIAATELGIRSMHSGTMLTSLNDGRGIITEQGNDIRITTRSGASFEIDVDGAVTLQDVIDRFNTAGGGQISAALVSSGNGLIITDNTAGGGALRIERVNLSAAIDGLGLNVQPTGNQLIGQDVSPVRVDGTFTALIELRDALNASDRQEITQAAERLERVLPRMLEVEGKLAAKARTMDERATRMEAETTASRILLSDVRDVDYAEAVVRFQQMQTALQANYTTSARVLNLSLLDYLR
ncbi:flagellar hook-associated protein FlgL [Phycisphaerae bacterium RAS1]|nr:flagellar hook-associated protein FlgL [Phycisphaerae bacterium RAS1]